MPELKTNDEQILYWNEKGGPKWVALQEKLDAQIAPYTRAVLDRVALTPGERVLDIGCGCGASTLAAAERVGAAGSCMGVDISWGMGASNSVISVGNSDTLEKLAQFTAAGLAPNELAEAAVCFGLHFARGKGTPARINPERNGPGQHFIKHLKALEYANIHCDRLPASEVEGGTDDEYGWWSTPKSKWTLIEDYRYGLTRDRIVEQADYLARGDTDGFEQKFGKL